MNMADHIEFAEPAGFGDEEEIAISFGQYAGKLGRSDAGYRYTRNNVTNRPDVWNSECCNDSESGIPAHYEHTVRITRTDLLDKTLGIRLRDIDRFCIGAWHGPKSSNPVLPHAASGRRIDRAGYRSSPGS